MISKDGPQFQIIHFILGGSLVYDLYDSYHVSIFGSGGGETSKTANIINDVLKELDNVKNKLINKHA